METTEGPEQETPIHGSPPHGSPPPIRHPASAIGVLSDPYKPSRDATAEEEEEEEEAVSSR